MKHRIFVYWLPFLAASAFAQDVTAPEVVEARRYTVEMIIFSYEQSVSAGTEVFVPDLPPADERVFDDEFPDGVKDLEPIEVAVRRRSNRYEIVMLNRSDFTLDDAYQHLRRLDAYKPLLHFGWTQATYPDQKLEPLPLSAFVTPPAGLEGSLNLYLSRFLHLAVELKLEKPGSGSADQYPVFYTISEDRIFRNGDLRYFDHPKFGVLAKITRLEESEPTPDET